MPKFIRPLSRPALAGFTLIELAVILLLLGVMMGFGLEAITSRNVDENLTSTQERLQEVEAALTQYALRNDRYPCPAPGVARDDANFGQSVNATGAGNCAGTNISRNGGVAIGTIPVRELGLSNSFATDAWGNLLTYAITEASTQTDGVEADGAIEVRQVTGRTSSEETTDSTVVATTYVLLSHGEDGMGARSAMSGNVNAANCTGDSSDAENCDNSDNTFYDAAIHKGLDSNIDLLSGDDVMIYKAITAPKCSLPWGGTTPHGSSVTAYSNASPLNQSCTNFDQVRTCDNGVLSGDSQFNLESCTARCSLPWGGEISHPSSVTAYSEPTPAGPCSSVRQTRTCNDGTLSGSYTYKNCTNGCSLPWGGYIRHTNSVTAYSDNTPAGVCSNYDQTRTCNNGSLSGSYTNQSCINGCSLPWGGYIRHGNSVTAYSTSNPSGPCSSYDQTRSCSAGSLSGSYTRQSCTSGCTATTRSWSVSGASCSGSISSARHGDSRTASQSGQPSGSANFSCSSGSWGGPSGASCSCSVTLTCSGCNRIQRNSNCSTTNLGHSTVCCPPPPPP
ncbi:MAG: hypothetical protein CMM94_01505, partial [Rickettsiales bacterium]|nr:hypothetical protein [Rickettsiales bacterium]